MNHLTDPVILIVDPDSISAAGTCAVLQYQKYDVHAAESSTTGLQLARAMPLDLLICDEQVDGRGGLDFVEEVHRLPERRDLPVMFVSRHQQAGVIRRRHRFGAAYHLKKPLDAVTLIELIERVLWLPMTQPPGVQPHFKPTGITPAQGTHREDRSGIVPTPHVPAIPIGDAGIPLAGPNTCSPPPLV